MDMRISADYDIILRKFSQATGKSGYIPEVLYKMRVGGVSNRIWANIRLKMEEDMLAIRRNHVSSLHTLALTKLSKIGQFRERPQPSG